MADGRSTPRCGSLLFLLQPRRVPPQSGPCQPANPYACVRQALVIRRNSFKSFTHRSILGALKDRPDFLCALPVAPCRFCIVVHAANPALIGRRYAHASASG